MRITRWGGAVIFGAALGLAVASPGYAQDGHFPDAGWDVRQIGAGDTDWSPAAESQITGAGTVELTKPDGTTGTSIETTDLGLNVASGDTITVGYELLDGADFAAGAVRLFWYDTPDADTLGEAPTAFVAADAEMGALIIDIGVDATVGTLGLVYDASNDSAGTVRFTGLVVGGTSVLFEAPADAGPSPSPSGEPAKPEPSEDPAPGKGGELPKTGSTLLVLGAAGGGLAAAGGGVYWLARRRRVVTG